MGKKYAYCEKCGKQVKKPKRKSLDSFHYQILIISTLATLGFALVAFIIYRLVFQKKKFCPRCGAEVDFYKSPEEVPKKVPVINLMEKLEEKNNKNQEEKEQKEEKKSTGQKQYKECESCGQEIDKNAKICPFCGVEQSVEHIQAP